MQLSRLNGVVAALFLTILHNHVLFSSAFMSINSLEENLAIYLIVGGSISTFADMQRNLRNIFFHLKTTDVKVRVFRIRTCQMVNNKLKEDGSSVELQIITATSHSSLYFVQASKLYTLRLFCVHLFFLQFILSCEKNDNTLDCCACQNSCQQFHAIFSRVWYSPIRKALIYSGVT